MSITPSASAEVRTLIAALASGDEVKRESAIARLAIIGPRATERVIAAYGTADRETRIGMLRVLEAAADARALPFAREALTLGGDLAVTAAGTLRPLLDAPDEQVAADALDALVSVALSADAERRVRLAAFEALRDMPPTVRERVEAALKEEGPVTSAAEAVWQDAVEGHLPEDPAPLKDAIKAHEGSAPLGVLQKMIDAVRQREAAVPDGSRRDAWFAVRGALHQALALRGSTIAVYDLRETLEGPERPLPSSFVTALHAVGDASCLEPLASFWSESRDDVARHQLAAAFQAIVKREKVTKRSAILKRIAARTPDLIASR